MLTLLHTSTLQIKIGVTAAPSHGKTHLNLSDLSEFPRIFSTVSTENSYLSVLIIALDERQKISFANCKLVVNLKCMTLDKWRVLHHWDFTLTVDIDR